MKKILTLVLAITLLTWVGTSLVHARGFGWGRGRENGYHMFGGRGRGDCANFNNYRSEKTEPVTKDEAKKLADRYAELKYDGNIKIGEMKETRRVYEVDLLTKKSGDLVDTILIDKDTGSIN
jgi:hypothetical protein